MRSPDPSIRAVLARAPESCGLRDACNSDAYLQARRAMEICNACRYCEGFCAVFPAMTRRRSFEERDLDYLANLCHGCRSCYFSCQYAPPHEFGVNIPRSLADVRLRSYERYAWPAPLGRAFRRNGTTVLLVAALGIALGLILVTTLLDASTLTRPVLRPGDFYAIVPHSLMVALAGCSFVFAALAVTIGAVRFWRAIAGSVSVSPGALREALRDVLTLRNLGRHANRGCNDRDERYSNLRRRFHHTLFYGFLLCFAATSTATVYEYAFGWSAPYRLLSLPVQLGLWGGVCMLVGCAGLSWLKGSGDPSPASPAGNTFDRALLAVLALVALSGVLLLALRASPCVGILLAVHLGLVVAFFIMTPYSKMVHGAYRSAALLLSAVERRREATAVSARRV